MVQSRNMSADHSRRLVSEYVTLEEQRNALDDNDARLRSELAANNASARELAERQERIADVLGPALRKTGAVYCLTDVGVHYAVDVDPNESLLMVTKLAPAGLLELPPRFTHDEIRDAAFREAYQTVFGGRRAVVDLPGRQAVVSNGVAVIDQEVG